MIVTHALAAGLKVRLGAAPPSPSPKALERVGPYGFEKPNVVKPC